ncbi:MAG: aldo/keto reductase [Micrococcales bacterium]
MSFSLEQMPIVTLNSGQQIPQLGLGVYKVTQDIADSLVQHAIEVGYRRIDTAALYDNELEVGAAIRKSGLPRSELFVTTKIWNDRQGYASSLEAIDESLEKLNIDYIDMLLIHWPVPKQDRYLETWRAFEEALASGRVKGIGVSNFEPEHLERLLANSQITPALNQVELHPGLQQSAVRGFGIKHGIATEAWSPLARGRFSENPTLIAIAGKHGKSVTQVIIRWHIQLGNLVIPKTSNPDRLVENIDVFDFELDASDMEKIAGLDSNLRTGFHPNEF